MIAYCGLDSSGSGMLPVASFCVHDTDLRAPLKGEMFCLVLVFLATDTEVSGSIPGATRFFWVVVGLERGLLSLVSLVRSTEELLE